MTKIACDPEYLHEPPAPEPVFKVGTWVQLRSMLHRNVLHWQSLPMLIIQGPYKVSKYGFEQESALLFWLDSSNAPHEQELPTCALALLGT